MNSEASRQLTVHKHQKSYARCWKLLLQHLQKPGNVLQLARGIHSADEDSRLGRCHFSKTQEAHGPSEESLPCLRVLGVMMPNASPPDGGKDCRAKLALPKNACEGQEVFETFFNAADNAVRRAANPIEWIGELGKTQCLQGPCHATEAA